MRWFGVFCTTWAHGLANVEHADTIVVRIIEALPN